jgi:hypothetical protein
MAPSETGLVSAYEQLTPLACTGAPAMIADVCKQISERSEGDNDRGFKIERKVRLERQSLANLPVVHRALASLTNINVTDLNLNNVPNWVDNTWVRQWLNSKLANRMCFDVTSLVSLYVQQGGRL